MLRHSPFMICLILFFSGCNRNMRYQASYRAFEKPMIPPAHTVPVTEEKNIPALTREVLLSGKELYEKNCSMCHGYTGDGKGFVTYKGLDSPPAFIDERIYQLPPQEIVNVITNGLGGMPSYQRRLKFEERWFVAYYVKALQLSRKFPVQNLKDEDRRNLP